MQKIFRILLLMLAAALAACGGGGGDGGDGRGSPAGTAVRVVSQAPGAHVA